MNNQTGSTRDQKHKLAVLLWSLIAVTGGATFVWVLSIPSDPKNAVLWGLSAERLLMVGVIIFMVVLSCLMVWANARKAAVSALFLRFLDDQQAVLRIALPLAMMVVGNVLLIPAVRFGDWQAYFLRLQPLLAWLFVSLLLLWLYQLLCFGSGWASLRTAWREQRRELIISAFALAGFGLLWLVMVTTGLGVVPDIFWNEGSVPLMALQVWLALLVAGLFFVFERRIVKKAGESKKLWYFDLGIMLLIWVITALVWQAQPMKRHYMLTNPTAPNYEYYSFSDAATYDTGARYVSLGQGINNQRATDKPFYLFVLGIFQAIAGYGYADVIVLQTIMLALLPAILYRVGMLMHSRRAGLLIAVLALFKEVNAIRATLEIQVSHSKLMMTEFPTALMLALTAWALLEWWHTTGGKQASAWLVWAGGLAAMAAMTRANAYVVVAAAAGLVFLSGKISWKRLKLAGLFLLGFLLVAAPWFLSGRAGRSAFAKFNFLTQARFEQTAPLPDEPGEALRYQDQTQTVQDDERGIIWLTATHFLHNLLGTTLSFPVQIPYDDLNTTLQAPRWDKTWDGSLPTDAAILMIVNLAIVAIGMGFARKNNTFVGWLPLVFLLAYHAANGVVRNSGSRYLVPVEWAALVYYGIRLRYDKYRLLVCGSTSIVDLAMNPLNGGTDTLLDFTLQKLPAELPGTGFPVGSHTILPVQPLSEAYSSTGLTLNMPTLNVSTPIIGVPLGDDGWDTTWLGNYAGFLEGSAFPTWNGNTVITGHVWGSSNRPGIFADLRSLKYGDEIKIHAWGQVFTYEVRSNAILNGGNVSSVLRSEQLDWLTLLTCDSFDADSNSYRYRRVVRAVLVRVE